MSWTKSIPFRRDVNEMLAEVFRLAAQWGIAFDGNISAGRFAGNTKYGYIAGSYTVSGRSLNVTLTDCPNGFFVNPAAVFGKISEWANS